MALEMRVGELIRDGSGWACFDAVMQFYADNNIDCFLKIKQPREWLESLPDALATRDKLTKPEPGSLLVMHLPNGRWHLGAYVGQGRFIHAHADRTALGRLSRYAPHIQGIYTP